MSVQTLATLTMLAVNIGALIWGAAKLSSTVQAQGEQLSRIAIVVDSLIDKIAALDNRMTRNETRLDAVESEQQRKRR